MSSETIMIRLLLNLIIKTVPLRGSKEIEVDILINLGARMCRFEKLN